MKTQITLSPILYQLLETIRLAGGQPLLVGGCVRDAILGRSMTDVDIEVFGYDDLDALKSQLTRFGAVQEVGKAFAVMKLSIQEREGLQEIDISFPRREIKTSAGHRGFSVDIDPHMTFEQAAARRDFTINAIGYDPFSNEIFDPYDGCGDLKRGYLKHVGPAFVEDPLRVYRAMQLLARFHLVLDSGTRDLCRLMDLRELAKERLFEEFRKLLLKGEKPSLGFQLLRDIGALSYFPELQALIDVPQDPEWHPEGDVWIHTLQVVDEMAVLRTGDDERDLILMFAALCHDFGKPGTTAFFEGRWRSHGHEEEGVLPTLSFLDRLTDHQALRSSVVALVRDHLKPGQLYWANQEGRVKDGAIRRLSLRVSIPDLVLLGVADSRGSRRLVDPVKPFPAADWLLKRAQDLDVADRMPKPILMGRHLLERGHTPGPEMGQVLQAAFEAQLDGKFYDIDGAISWLESSDYRHV